MLITRIKTEGDCEGRSIRTIGLFTGSLDQIMTYLVGKGVKPEYHFYAETVDVVECNHISAELHVTEGSYGRLVYETPTALQFEIERQSALAKLNPTERKLLWLN